MEVTMIQSLLLKGLSIGLVLSGGIFVSAVAIETFVVPKGDIQRQEFWQKCAVAALVATVGCFVGLVFFVRSYFG
jgi:hypothetical protein